MNAMTLLVCLLLAAAQGPKVGEVESSFDKSANFASFRTYSWHAGYDAYDPEIHKMIVAALETEMTGLGFKKVPSGGDVTLAYYSVASTEVDLKALEKMQREGKTTAPPSKTLGRLMVVMRRAGKDDRLWTVNTREHVDRAQAEATIHAVAKRMFETYPGRARAKD